LLPDHSRKTIFSGVCTCVCRLGTIIWEKNHGNVFNITIHIFRLTSSFRAGLCTAQVTFLKPTPGPSLIWPTETCPFHVQKSQLFVSKKQNSTVVSTPSCFTMIIRLQTRCHQIVSIHRCTNSLQLYKIIAKCWSNKYAYTSFFPFV
jgi:hypothetical protein